MSKLFISFVLGTAIAALPALTSAKGCLKGAAVGGVAGHVAGHHGLIGAAAGCAIEHHRETKQGKAGGQPSAPSSDKSAAPVPVNSGLRSK